MPFRDLFLFVGFACVAPAILLHPYIGALAWVVFGLLNPQRLTYGPAYSFPFSLIIAVLTALGILITRDHRKIKGGPAGVVLIVMAIWTTITTFYALTPDAAWEMWPRVMKIFAMTLVLMFLLHTKRQIHLLLAAIILSIGFYGVKGGVFTILTGGHGMVNGPEDSVIMGNNALGVANVMIIPLFAHFYQQTKNRWIRVMLVGCILLCAAAVLGSWSRGAFLALIGMGMVLWARSSRKALTAALLLATALVLVPFMPQRWDARIHTIENYEQEGSAMARIYAWHAAWNIATDRFFGGGFEYPTPQVMAKYSPGPYVSVAHSIYFQALGEHGFVGLGIFLLFWILVWFRCGSVRRRARDRPDLEWAFSLMSMIQASMVGYAIGGAFLNLAFWDMPYYVYAVIVVSDYVVRTSPVPQKAGASSAEAEGRVDARKLPRPLSTT